jgi:hypothetical protein
MEKKFYKIGPGQKNLTVNAGHVNEPSMQFPFLETSLDSADI